MKRKVKLTDAITGKIIEGEKEIRNTLHFEVQRTTKAQVFDDRRKRKPKHKKNLLEED